MDKQVVLHIIDGDYGLVSMDVGCIQSILYAKLCKVPTKLDALTGIKSCALYSAPSLESGNTLIESTLNIITYLNNTYENLDKGLSPKQTSETLALINLTYKLKPVLDFLYWVDQRNCDELVSRWYMSALPFPFNYSYTKRKKNEAIQLMEILYPLDNDLEIIKDFMTKSATQCLSTLSARLGNLKHFHGGENPTNVDVVVYSHLAPLIKLPFPSNDISSSLSMWPNLAEFVKKIDTKYFADVKKEVKYLVVDEANKQNDDEVSYMAVFILFVSATSLALGFAVKRGFINFSRQ